MAFTLIAVHGYPPLVSLLLPFALLVALSRVVLGLHYPSDVLAGALLGASWGCWPCTRRSSRFNRPVKARQHGVSTLGGIVRCYCPWRSP